MTVSVIVCTHLAARLHLLRAALESLAAQTLPADEVIVVVDAPDDLARQVEALGLADVVVPMGQQSGLSRARNAGIAASSHELVAFLDDDATADPGWLAGLVRSLTDDRAALGVSGRSVPMWESSQPTWLPDEFLWVVGCSYRGLPEDRAVVRNFFGGCACIRRSVFDRVGGFRSELGRTLTGHAGGEEAELCLRAANALSGHFLYEPDAVIRHRVPDGRATRRYFVDRCLGEGASKALVQALSGWAPLETESAFLRHTIPAAVLTAARGVPRRNWSAAAKLAPLLTGVGVTGAGYLKAKRRLRKQGGRIGAPPAIPVQVPRPAPHGSPREERVQ